MSSEEPLAAASTPTLVEAASNQPPFPTLTSEQQPVDDQPQPPAEADLLTVELQRSQQEGAPAPFSETAGLEEGMPGPIDVPQGYYVEVTGK